MRPSSRVFFLSTLDARHGTSLGWYHPAVLKPQELVEAGELGRIQYLYSNRLNLGNIRREENILWSFGERVKIQNNVSVYEGVTLEDHVFCSPSMISTNVFNPREPRSARRTNFGPRGSGEGRAWGPTALLPFLRYGWQSVLPRA